MILDSEILRAIQWSSHSSTADNACLHWCRAKRVDFRPTTQAITPQWVSVGKHPPYKCIKAHNQSIALQHGVARQHLPVSTQSQVSREYSKYLNQEIQYKQN